MSRSAAKPASRPRVPAKGIRLARRLAQGTILAAGIAATQFGIPEIDPRFQVFSRTLVDRLQLPISRYHE